MTALNPDSHLPLYAQLAERLLAQIRSGEFKSGEKIPSEHELTKHYGIGRPTVRQATEKLIQRGYLERKRGAGTYVLARSQSIDLFSLGGTISSFSEQGFELSTRMEEAPHLVTVSEGEAGEESVHPMAHRQAYRMTRLGSVQGAPVLLERLWFAAEVFPFLDQLDLAGKSLSEMIFLRYRMEATSAQQRFSVTRLAAPEAKLLVQEEGAVVLRVERELNFPSARLAIFVEMKCAGNRFTFSQNIGTEHG